MLRSLVKDDTVDSLETELNDKDIDFAIITETFLKVTDADNIVDIEDFEIYRMDRRLGRTTKRCRGGVVIYASNLFVCWFLNSTSAQ
jgi:hypothetical protein